MDTTYVNLSVPLDSVVTDVQRKYVDGAQKGVLIYGVYIVKQNFVDNPIPTGAQVKLYFGENDEIILADDMVAFEFPCGHDGGILFSNATALAGKSIRLLVDYSGFSLRRET